MEQIEYLEKLSIIEFFKYFKRLDDKQVLELINNPYLKYLSDEKFNFVFFNLNVSQASVLLKNESLYNKVMNLPNKSNNKTIFDILQESKIDILKLLIESPYAIKYQEKVLNHIISTPIDELNKLLKKVEFSQFNSLFDDKNQLFNYITKKFGQIDIDILETYYTKINNKSLNPLKILKIHNYKEFILYTKFGVLIEVDSDLSEITLKNGIVLPMNEILNCKSKYIVKLMELLKNKGLATEEELFISSLKLYYIFGFDNAKKIIEDKFSKMTDLAIERLNNFEFKDSRREFRSKNQQKFYHYQMIEDIINSFANGNDEVFKNLLYEPTIENINALKQEFQLICSSYNGDELKTEIKKKIAEKITERENLYKEENYVRLKNHNFENPILTAKDICELFKNVDIKKIMEYDNQTMISLQEFLLGNTKANNDCLLRLIINRSALGLEENLATIINEFKYIAEIITKSDLSLNSILDVIDILKVKLYDLRPNEADIYLSSISRLVNAVEFKERDVNVVKETCNLHIKRKQKVSSSIPIVKGKTDYYTYEVAPFDAEYLLTAGLDAKNCFRISGLGEDFFRYCLTSRNAVIVYLKDSKGNKHICPIVRSGNAISCNGIDPEVSDEYKKQALDALSKCFCDMMNISCEKESRNQQIEVGTITDLHMKEYFSKYKYPSYTLEETLPIDFSCYTDYNKRDTKHYILAKSKSYKNNKYYIPETQYYQKRDENYEYDMTEEFDYERISLIVNSIMYSAIDYLDIPNKEKNKKKRFYKLLDAKNFKYIIGNKDWFIAIDEQLNTIGTILPYDKRAMKDYIMAYSKTKEMLEKLMGEKFDRKNR